MIAAHRKPVTAALLALVAFVLAFHGRDHEPDTDHAGGECVLCQAPIVDLDDAAPSLTPALGTGQLLPDEPAEPCESAAAAPHPARGPPLAFA